MRIALVLVLLLPALGGCLDAGSIFSPDGLRKCREPAEFTWYLGPGLALGPDLPENGVQAGNGFDEAFLTNELDEWMSPSFSKSWIIDGDVSFTFWTRGINTPAPIVLGGAPGEGYHFFNQFGSNRGFVESYAIEYATAFPDAELRRYDETFSMPEGGYRLEAGDHLRLLLTNLVLDDPETGRGPDILYGTDTPSAIRYTARCVPTESWSTFEDESTPVAIPLHHGLLTGAVPATAGINYADVAFRLDPRTDRLTIRVEGAGIVDNPKSDIDLSVQDQNGEEVWSIGSPYTNEIGTYWKPNLNALMPPGDYVVRVNSYSGHAYQGTVTITQDMA